MAWVRSKSFTEDRGIYMNSTLVDKVVKNKLEEIWVSALRNNLVDIRIYFYFPNQPEPKPTKKGIWISFKHIPKLIQAFEKLIANPEALVDVELKSDKKSQLRTYSAKYDNKNLVHIRQFYLKAGEFAPGRGIAFPLDVLPRMIEALKKAAPLDGKV